MRAFTHKGKLVEQHNIATFDFALYGPFILQLPKIRDLDSVSTEITVSAIAESRRAHFADLFCMDTGIHFRAGNRKFGAHCKPQQLVEPNTI